MIDVYRALTGPSHYSAGKYYYEGVSPDDLATTGICTSNRSSAQHVYTFEIFEEDAERYVPGLPVFLNRSGAEAWLEGKKFRHTERGLAAIAIAHIDEADITSRRIEVIRNMNSGYRRGDYKLSLHDLQQNQSGEWPITGECYVPDFPCAEMLGSTTLLVARAHMLDGSISREAQPELIDFAEFQSASGSQA